MGPRQAIRLVGNPVLWIMFGPSVAALLMASVDLLLSFRGWLFYALFSLAVVLHLCSVLITAIIGLFGSFGMVPGRTLKRFFLTHLLIGCGFLFVCLAWHLWA